MIEAMGDNEREITEEEKAAIFVRLPDKFLWKGFKERLYQNDC